MNLFEQEEEEDYYKSVRIGNFWNNYCIEYESDGDRNKTLYQLKNTLIKLDRTYKTL